MKKVIAIFGAGPGLGSSVAHRFGREGYAVALVARRRSNLDALVAELENSGIIAVSFTGDLGLESTITPVIHEIKNTLGRIDAVYYSPAGTEACLPASTMTVEMMRSRSEYLFLGLVGVVNNVLPDFKKNGQGAILAAFGGTASVGIPYMSGPAPAQAAARNYLMSLHGEVAQENIHVGIVTISAVIKGSAYHSTVEAGEADVPPDTDMPVIDPNILADKLWEAASGRGEVEFVCN
ncbi:SDR family NAD(P)-dependent oxidoreductase [Pseudomonas syringae]|uniref:SDR family NAD(P)-dependent oxidoreductase n=1 Tax=Pseudomonas syringae TaxID=317 RepID=UPI003CE7D34D